MCYFALKSYDSIVQILYYSFRNEDHTISSTFLFPVCTLAEVVYVPVYSQVSFLNF